MKNNKHCNHGEYVGSKHKVVGELLYRDTMFRRKFSVSELEHFIAGKEDLCLKTNSENKSRFIADINMLKECRAKMIENIRKEAEEKMAK